MSRMAIALIIAFLAGCATLEQSSRVSHADSQFAKINKEMTRKQVYRLIGPPTAMDSEHFRGLDDRYAANDPSVSIEQWLVEAERGQFAELVILFGPEGDVVGINRAVRKRN